MFIALTSYIRGQLVYMGQNEAELTRCDYYIVQLIYIHGRSVTFVAHMEAHEHSLHMDAHEHSLHMEAH